MSYTPSWNDMLWSGDKMLTVDTCRVAKPTEICKIHSAQKATRGGVSCGPTPCMTSQWWRASRGDTPALIAAVSLIRLGWKQMSSPCHPSPCNISVPEADTFLATSQNTPVLKANYWLVASAVCIFQALGQLRFPNLHYKKHLMCLSLLAKQRLL